MLVLHKLGLKVISNFSKLLISLVKIQKLSLNFIVPDPMDLEFLILKRSSRLELFIATHSVIRSIQLQFTDSHLQSTLDHYVQFDSSLLSDGHTLYLVGQFEEFYESETLFIFKMRAAVKQGCI